MKIYLNIQSIVDVITNSSTEVFVMATDSTIEYTKKLLCKILQISEDDVDARFDIDTYVSDYNYTGISISCKSENPDDISAMNAITDLLDSILCN